MESGRERYVFLSFPHIALSPYNDAGVLCRPGRPGKSSACGALIACLGQLKSEGVDVNCKQPGGQSSTSHFHWRSSWPDATHPQSMAEETYGKILYMHAWSQKILWWKARRTQGGRELGALSTCMSIGTAYPFRCPEVVQNDIKCHLQWPLTFDSALSSNQLIWDGGIGQILWLLAENVSWCSARARQPRVLYPEAASGQEIKGQWHQRVRNQGPHPCGNHTGNTISRPILAPSRTNSKLRSKWHCTIDLTAKSSRSSVQYFSVDNQVLTGSRVDSLYPTSTSFQLGAADPKSEW